MSICRTSLNDVDIAILVFHTGSVGKPVPDVAGVDLAAAGDAGDAERTVDLGAVATMRRPYQLRA